MSRQKYLIHAKNPNFKLEITYIAARITNMKVRSGSLSKRQWEAIGKMIPSHPDDINPLREYFDGRVTYQSITSSKPASTFKVCMDLYNAFYNDITKGISPKLNGITTNKLKSIITYLRKNCSNEDEVIAVWDQILSNWNNLPEFYQKQIDLKQIDSNMNNIIIELKSLDNEQNSDSEAISKFFDSNNKSA